MQHKAKLFDGLRFKYLFVRSRAAYRSSSKESETATSFGT